MDPDGRERRRLEGYLPKDEFRAWLENSLARLAFVRKDFADAERRYAAVTENHPDSKFAPEAIYYKGVSRYSASHNGADLAATAETLNKKHPDSEWQLRSLPWLREKTSMTSG
jgi:TolA-binding protein